MLIKATLLTELPEKKKKRERRDRKRKDKKDILNVHVEFYGVLNCDTVFADWTDEGKLFQRITCIERGIKPDRLDILLTAGTGYGSLRN